MIRNGENFKGVETRHIRASGDTWNEKTDVKALLQTLLNRLYNRTSVEAEMTSATATTTYYHSQQKPPWAPSGIKLRNAPDI